MRRFALHLARTVERTVDVDGMLERMTPEQFDEWHRYYLEQPWGDDWQQAGTIAATIHNELVRLSCGFGGTDVKPKMLDKPDAYIPKVQEEKKIKRIDPKVQAQRIRSMFGV